jgi:hypothetical protein
MSQACGATCKRATPASANQIHNFWRNNGQQVWRDEAQFAACRKVLCRTLQHAATVIILSLMGHESGNSFGHAAISRYSPYSQRACSVGHQTQLSIPLVSQGVASCNCPKSHIDKFFCERHTIVAAASQFAATREFVERAASADRADEQAFKPSFSSHHVPEHSIKRHISPIC